MSSKYDFLKTVNRHDSRVIDFVRNPIRKYKIPVDVIVHVNSFGESVGGASFAADDRVEDTFAADDRVDDTFAADDRVEDTSVADHSHDYDTEMTLPETAKIVAVSDLHADLHVFIVQLRDCARVISKHGFDPDAADSTLEEQLFIDIIDSDGSYDDSLGYRWVGQNTHVVICGDILDGHRTGGAGVVLLSKYPQIEIKLVRFMNAIDAQARKSGGRIIKLFGNHELMNIIDDDFNYIFPANIGDDKYYRGCSREQCFKVGNIGFDLLMTGGCRPIVVLNDNIFVHAQIGNGKCFKTLAQFTRITYVLRDAMASRWQEHITAALQDINGQPSCVGHNELWERSYGDVERIHHSISDRRGGDDKFCESVISDFASFFATDQNERKRIFVGHCPQHTSTVEKNKANKTFVHRTEDGNRWIYTANVENPPQEGIPNENSKLNFGITMECSKHNPNDHYIYRVDVASSRAFDEIDNILYTLRKEYLPTPASIDSFLKKYYYSRTPQVVEIDKIFENGVIVDNVQIIKSTIGNTLKHVPRPYLDAALSVILNRPL